jgi:F-type H+-transporting ATPase subunit gamma
MANLKEIRNRISSVSSTMKITSAMKMVSAAKLKKAQDAIVAMRPYSNKLTGILQDLSSSIDSDNIFIQNRSTNKNLIVCITSNRGLCGGFNSNIVKECINIAEKQKNKEIAFFCLGKKGSDLLSKKYNVVLTNNKIFDNLSFENVKEVAEILIKKFVEKEFDTIQIVYNRFKNAATQIVTNEKFLPITPVDDQQDNNLQYIFEPSKLEIVNELIPKSLRTQLFKALRDSYASEHGARMTAMHKATDNATELRDQLKLTYNKARQAAITNEILEIVGGAEALNN